MRRKQFINLTGGLDFTRVDHSDLSHSVLAKLLRHCLKCTFLLLLFGLGKNASFSRQSASPFVCQTKIRSVVGIPPLGNSKSGEPLAPLHHGNNFCCHFLVGHQRRLTGSDGLLGSFSTGKVLFSSGESQNPEGMCALMDFREDGVTPYMLFFKDGLDEEKVVRR